MLGSGRMKALAVAPQLEHDRHREHKRERDHHDDDKRHEREVRTLVATHAVVAAQKPPPADVVARKVVEKTLRNRGMHEKEHDQETRHVLGVHP